MSGVDERRGPVSIGSTGAEIPADSAVAAT